ncbi:MAG: hypothetical protein M5U11_02630 [Anaerolineales bacterium]|nr:hypothetical protein [Anaerolineales bacterium]
MPVSNRPLHAIFAIFILLSLTLSACQPGQGGTSAPPPAPAATQTPSPAYTPTPLPPRTLNVCLGAAPNTLYPLGGPNAAARSVLEAVYDGPFDALGYDYKPVILEKMPNLEDGSVQLASVSVTNGNEVADADGTLTILKAGTRVRPAGMPERRVRGRLRRDQPARHGRHDRHVQTEVRPALVRRDAGHRRRFRLCLYPREKRRDARLEIHL